MNKKIYGAVSGLMTAIGVIVMIQNTFGDFYYNLIACALFVILSICIKIKATKV